MSLHSRAAAASCSVPWAACFRRTASSPRSVSQGWVAFFILHRKLFSWMSASRHGQPVQPTVCKLSYSCRPIRWSRLFVRVGSMVCSYDHSSRTTRIGCYIPRCTFCIVHFISSRCSTSELLWRQGVCRGALCPKFWSAR